MVLAIILAGCFAAVAAFIAWDNKALEVTEYRLDFENLPDSFNGFKIVHISDLHNETFGAGNKRLLDMIADESPDIIAVTGDLIDSRHTDIPTALTFMEGACKIAPVYFTAGNHEKRLEDYGALADALAKKGVNVLDNRMAILSRGGEEICIGGFKDPDFKVRKYWGHRKNLIKRGIKEIFNGAPTFKILLCHRPELFKIYEKCKTDLVLTGHVHGGQFRFPGLGGLFGPSQGWFPTYDAGVYSEEGTRMVISRGLGNSSFPFRFNNRPEVVVITLTKAETPTFTPYTFF